eukprot:TRINITY_DN154_c0_g1_i2.p2 TRINITY_DN154_c0_g1~~TRINITY_DN154_c0_g1_i2.p2  ORF type:complete len:169 (-),score=43.54 TRINITY_DN154_c0_g1_i2:3-509(-)
MQIFARTAAGETLAVEVSEVETVSSLREKLQGLSEVPVVEQTLTFGGCPLDGDSLLSEYGIQGESTILMGPRLLGGGDGTPAMGKRHKKTHGLCPRCGKRSYHLQKKRCASCGYPAAKIRSYEWSKKAKRRRAPGTGRMAYKKTLARKFKNGFRSGTTAPARRKNQKS